MLPHFMTLRVNLNCHVSQLCLCYYALPEPFACMLPPSHGGTGTMTLEAPVSWLFRDESDFSRRPFSLFYYHVVHLSCGAYGCILVFSCYVYRVIGWCVLYTPSHGADPSTQISDRGHPSSARWGSPSTHGAHSMLQVIICMSSWQISSYIILSYVPS